MNRWYCPIKLFEYCEDRIWVRVSRMSAKNFLGRLGRSPTPFQAILKELGKRVLIVPISACGLFALGTREPMGIDRRELVTGLAATGCLLARIARASR